MQVIKDSCRNTYNEVFSATKKKLLEEYTATSRTGTYSEERLMKIENEAQKEAIKCATIETMRKFPATEAAAIWKAVYEVHIHRKSGIDDSDTIAKVVSADQSWKKSSGHAFEEMIALLGTAALEDSGIKIVLQRDLNLLIKAGELANEPRDISWLKEQIKSAVFDLYALVTRADGKLFCFGCIQSKTSIRDRVTRDREPSLQAMASYFWSTIIVLDGDFLRLPKFVNMVNGGTTEHPQNGWHGLYVFSEQYSEGRIYSTDLDFKNFKEHAVYAANYWLKQRQWFDNTWMIPYKAEQVDIMDYEYIPNNDPELTPSYHGENCLGNGEHPEYECCCDECDYYLACFPDWDTLDWESVK